MLKIINYTGNVVELKKAVIGDNINTSFIYQEKDKINLIEVDTHPPKAGIKVHFASGKLLASAEATNYNAWLKRYFKLSI